MSVFLKKSRIYVSLLKKREAAIKYLKSTLKTLDKYRHQNEREMFYKERKYFFLKFHQKNLHKDKITLNKLQINTRGLRMTSWNNRARQCDANLSRFMATLVLYEQLNP